VSTNGERRETIWEILRRHTKTKPESAINKQSLIWTLPQSRASNLSCSSGPNANRQLFSPQVSEQQTTVMALVEIADVRFHIATAV